MPDQNPYCEMMLGWSGCTLAQIAERRQKGLVCSCGVRAGHACKWTGETYLTPVPECAVRLVEIDEVVIESTLWRAALAGDAAARLAVRKLVHGLHLSLHLLSLDPSKEHVVVTLRELDTLNLIDGVRCEAPPMPLPTTRVESVPCPSCSGEGTTAGAMSYGSNVEACETCRRCGGRRVIEREAKL